MARAWAAGARPGSTCALREDDTSIQPEDMVGRRDIGSIMGDAENCYAAIGLLGEDSARTSLALVIEACGGFVENEDPGGAGQSLSEECSLALASGEGRERASLQAAHLHPGDGTAHVSGALMGGAGPTSILPITPGSHGDHVLDGEAQRFGRGWPLDDECDIRVTLDDSSGRPADSC